DRTLTPMGARLMRGWVLEPLRQLEQITSRHEAVEEFATSPGQRGALDEALRGMRDMERVVSRAAVGTAGPRDIAVLRAALGRLPRVRELLTTAKVTLLQMLGEGLDPLHELHELLMKGLFDEPPATVRDGGVIRDGFD